MINAQLVLSPVNGKRLIAKAVVKSKEFRKAMDRGIVVLALGTTNALIYEEITGKKIDKEEYAAGVIKDYLGVTSANRRQTPIVLKNGQLVNTPWQDAIKEMDQDCLFIKGANAYDDSNLAGVLTGGEGGGTIGQALGTLSVRKVPIMVPVGVEKRVPSVLNSARLLSEPSLKTGNMQVSMVIITSGILLTELTAFQILFDVEASLVAAGGINGYEGSGVFNIKGTKGNVEEAVKLIEALNIQD